MRILAVVFALVALVSLSTLILRPIAVEFAGIGVDPQSIEIVGTEDGGHICKVKSDCISVTVSGLGLYTLPVLTTVLAATFMFFVPATFGGRRISYISSLVKPPPQFAAAF